MKVSIDTKEDSHEEIRKVIKMLQNLVGDSEEIFTNQPAESSAQPAESAFANIFGDASSSQESINSSETQETQTEKAAEETTESTEDLFAELFNEEEIKKMNQDQVKEEEAEEELPKTKDKKYSIEFYD